MAAEQPRPQSESVDPPSPKLGPVGVRAVVHEVVARIRHRPLRSLILIGVVSAAVIGLGIARSVLSPLGYPAAVTRLTLNDALRALDAGNLEQAREIAADLRVYGDLPHDQASGPPYILGSVMAQEADRHASREERAILYLLASRYLQEAQRAGFLADRRGHGEFELGRCLSHAGLLADSVAPLLSSRESYPRASREVHRLLAAAYLDEKKPQLAKALEFNGLYLADPSLTPKERDAARLVQSRILFELGEAERCRAQLEEIQPNSTQHPAALLIQGQLLMREGDLASGDAAASSDQEAPEAALAKYRAARDAFRSALDENQVNADFSRQSQYLLGACYRRMREHSAALDQFLRTSRLGFDTPEGIAAGVEVGELESRAGNFDNAMEAYRRVLRHATAMRVYVNRWLSWEDLRARIERAYHDFVNGGRFMQATELARAAVRLFGEDEAIKLQAEAQQKWAENLEPAAARAPAEAAKAIRLQSREARREAGRLYSELARLHFTTRQYPNDLWASAENFLRGQDYDRAVRVLRTYLKNQTRENRPPALTELGEALLALNRLQEAIEPLNECINFHAKSPFSYRARLLAAQTYLEMGRPDRAKELLVANLEHESLTPRSMEWRESLYTLGEILYQEGLRLETESRMKGVDSNNVEQRKAELQQLELAANAFREAIRYLGEAVARDEAAGRDKFAAKTIEARYRIGEARRRAAALPRKRLSLTSIETTRVALTRQMEQELAAAAQAYYELQNTLNGKQEQGELSPLEARILRNCCFARADALYDSGNYDEAIQAYSTATNRFQNEPESLEAYIQLANCLRHLNRTDEAQRTLEQAKIVLDGIRPDADFTKTTRYDREQWRQLLTWLRTL